MENTNAKIEIIQLDEKTIMTFIDVPEGYKLTKISLENHVSVPLGYLYNFNRIKKISIWKKQTPNLVEAFTKMLQSRDWDFIKYPKPYAFISKFSN